METFLATKQEKISKLLDREYGGLLGFSRIKSLLKNKDIKINGKRINFDCFVNEGDEIIVYYDKDICKRILSVVFEDDNILVVNKPKGTTSEAFYEAVKQNHSEALFCHRLDRNTDGIMIFAKNQFAYEEILDKFKNKLFEKFYVAEVYGQFKDDFGKLDNYLLKDSEIGKVEVVDKNTDGAVRAELMFEVLERKDRSTVLMIKLISGRTHQIRAQFGHIGHFVLGDGKYGNDKISKSFGIKNMMLTSKRMILHFSKQDKLYYLDGKILEI